ncbi:hypothetical protein Tco_1423057, partial [Tanacetum coccineum]
NHLSFLAGSATGCGAPANPDGTRTFCRHQRIPAAHKDIDDEVLKTIEVGSLLGFNLVGKEDMVRKTIGDSFVQS